MSADKRALDDLDALFRAVPAEAVSSARPSKKLRNAKTTAAAAGVASSMKPREREAASANNESHRTTVESQQMYTRLPPALLPLGLRPAPATPRGKNRTSVGAATAIRFTEFVRGVLSARGERAASQAIESKLRRKVVNLENVSSTQTEAQSAGMRAARSSSSSAGAARRGLSGKQGKKMGLNILEAKGGRRVTFRDLLGLHDVWKGYAVRLVSQCGSNERLVQQRVLAADLQGCYLTVSRASDPSLVSVTGIVLRETANTFQVVTPNSKTKTIPKRACAVRVAFGGLVINLDAKALMGRLGGQKGRGRKSPSVGGSGDSAEGFPLPTAAL